MRKLEVLKLKKVSLVCLLLITVLIISVLPNKVMAVEEENNIITIAKVASKYNKTNGDEGYEEYLDLNKDGIIDIYDIVIAARTFEEDWTLENSDISGLSSELLWWWYVPNNTNTVPNINSNIPFRLDDYNAIYVGDTSRKVIYLTFDTEYKTNNISKILDILKENDVKANFFVISWFIDNNPDLLKRIVNEGHLVANHSDTHQSMPSLTTDKMKFQNEVKNVESKFKALTNKSIAKYFRAPEGKYSEQSLKYIKDLGYKATFWSFSHVDWDDKNQPDKELAKKDIINNFHNGEIMLLHASSDTNTAVLDDVIKEGKRQGYSFEVLP